MKVKTLKRFRDKDNYGNIHEIGSEFECTNERGNHLIGLGFVEKVKEPKAKAEELDLKVETQEETPEKEVAETPKPNHSGKKKNRPYEGKKN